MFTAEFSALQDLEHALSQSFLQPIVLQYKTEQLNET
jgi:hypothetical protein